MDRLLTRIRITKDQLWKAIIQDFFEDFMYFFYPSIALRIDFEEGCEFLDKELDKLYPPADGKNRRADKLVKMRFKDNTEQALFIHIEVQGYHDPDFAERMFQYYYRIFDTKKVPLAALAIYTDDSPTFCPQNYEQRLDEWETLLHYKFKTYKLYDETVERLESLNNIFADIMLIAYSELSKNRPQTDEALLQLKTTFYRGLLKKGYKKEAIRKMMSFLIYYSSFTKTAFVKKLEQNFSIIDKKESFMGMDELVLMKYGEAYREVIIEEMREEVIGKVREEVREEVIGKVREEVREEVIGKVRNEVLRKKIFRLFKKGFSVEQIVDLFDMPQSQVEDLFLSFNKQEEDDKMNNN